MRKAITVLVVILSPSITFGQTHRSVPGLIGTTWMIYYNECRETNWTDHERITFLAAGRLQNSTGSWRLSGNKLIVNAADLYVRNLNVVMRGNEMTGTAELGMSNIREYCVRLVRQGIAPRGQPAGPPGGDGFAAFYANFKRAVLSNDRDSVRNMMSPVFLWALGDEESPEKALRDMDSREWQQLRVAVNRLPVRCKQPCLGYGGYHLDDRHLGELLFTQENGKWKWKGLLSD